MHDHNCRRCGNDGSAEHLAGMNQNCIHRADGNKVSRRGNCYDNATMESFWATLKLELVYRGCFETRAQARLQIFHYIEMFYNRQRAHSALDYHCPARSMTTMPPTLRCQCVLNCLGSSGNTI
jgi:hypothetical protein